MKFIEQKAAEIMAKWGLDPITVRVWRHRGEIPDEYENPEYKPRKAAEAAQQARALEILSMPEINVSRMWSVTNAQVRDIRAGQYRMSQEKYLRIQTEITQMRNLLRKYMQHASQDNLKAIIKDRRIKSARLLASEMNMYERLRKGLDAYDEELERAKRIIIGTYNRMKI